MPNKETAIKVAEIILVPIYGEDILKKKPFSARLINNKIWRVEGTTDLDKIGGVPIVEIQKCNCKILSVSHTKYVYPSLHSNCYSQKSDQSKFKSSSLITLIGV